MVGRVKKADPLHVPSLSPTMAVADQIRDSCRIPAALSAATAVVHINAITVMR